MSSLTFTFVQTPCPLSKADTHEYMISLPWLNYTVWQNADSLGWLNLILVILKHSVPLARRQRNWEQERELAHHFQCEDGRAYMRRNTVSPWLPSTAAKSLQSCPTLCDPIDGSPSGSPVPGILQARTLEWVAISFSNTWKWKVKVKSHSRVQPYSQQKCGNLESTAEQIGFSQQLMILGADSPQNPPDKSPSWLIPWLWLSKTLSRESSQLAQSVDLQN